MCSSWRRSLLWLARAATGSSLVLAAVGKAADIPGFSRHLAAVGVPGGMSPPLAVTGILAEAGVGVGVLVLGSRNVAWRSAVCLLGLFAGVESWRALIGLRGDCGCFGVWFALRPWQTWVVLSGLFAASLYGLLATKPQSNGNHHPRPDTRSSPQISPFIPSTALLLLVGIASLVAPEVIVLDPQSLRPRVPPLPVGSPMPSFRLNNDVGQVVSSRDLLGQPHVLLFVSNCSDCSAGTVMMWDRTLAETRIGKLVVLAPESSARLGAFRRKYMVSGMLLSTLGTDAAERCRVSALPMAYVVSAQGKVVCAWNGDQDLRSALGQAMRVLRGEASRAGREVREGVR